MSINSVMPSEFFNPETQVAEIALIACPGAEELTKQIDEHLKTSQHLASIPKVYRCVPDLGPRSFGPLVIVSGQIYSVLLSDCLIYGKIELGLQNSGKQGYQWGVFQVTISIRFNRHSCLFKECVIINAFECAYLRLAGFFQPGIHLKAGNCFYSTRFLCRLNSWCFSNKICSLSC